MLAENCPPKIAGLGGGYFGELDITKYEQLRASLNVLYGARQAFEEGIAKTKKRAEGEAKDEKARLDILIVSGSAFLKQADAFIESLKASDFSEKGTLYNAARYLAYAARTDKARVLDFDLRLEGMTITKENIFIGQRLRLAGVAFLWYRLYEPNGTLITAKALRQITKPIEVDLRGEAAPDDFWGPRLQNLK